MIDIIVLLGCFIAACTDCKTETIPKWCTYPLIIAGIFYRVSEKQMVLLVAVLLVWFLITYIPGIGGGDFKFLLGIALLEGPLFTFKMFITANCLTAIAYLSILIINKNIKSYRLQSVPMGLPFAMSTVIGLYAGFIL